MPSGFTTVKDFLDVAVVPLVLVFLTWGLARWYETANTRKFLRLIRRELEEMEPWPKESKAGSRWTDHLPKRLLHERIFENISDNRDFILSLPPDLAYNLYQLWSHFEKAQNSQTVEGLTEHGARWCNYILRVCQFFDQGVQKDFQEKVHAPWRRLIMSYHPDAFPT